MVTTASLAFGLMAMYHMVARNDESVRACWYILFAAVLDALDGMIARLTHTESEFGVQYDSLADAIVFGTTPAILMFLHLRGTEFITGAFFPKFAQFSCIVFTICGVLRLARFNVEKSSSGRRTFSGLPIPAAAAMVISTYLVFRDSDLPLVVQSMPVLMVLLALAMVSRFPYHSIKSIDIESPREFEVLLGGMLVIAALIALRSHLQWVIFFAMSAYVVSGPVGALLERRRGGDDDAASSADEEGAAAGGEAKNAAGGASGRGVVEVVRADRAAE